MLHYLGEDAEMEIQPVDIAYRRRVVRTLVAVAILLLVVLIAFQFWLQHLAMRLDPKALVATIRAMLLVCFSLIAICIGALGAHFLRRGGRIVLDRRFPPRDVRAVRATPVREGDAAVSIGRTCQIIGMVLVVIALLAAAIGWLWIGRT
jgi:hypothetical protein